MQLFEYLDDANEPVAVTAVALKELAESREIKPETLVRKAGVGEWRPASTVKGLTFPPEADRRFARELAPPPQPMLEPELIDASELMDEAASVPHLGTPVPNFSPQPKRWQSRHRDQWRSTAVLAAFLAGLHWFVAIVICGVGAFLLAFPIVALVDGDMGLSVRQMQTTAINGIAVLASAVPIMCLALVLQAIRLFALDRSE